MKTIVGVFILLVFIFFPGGVSAVYDPLSVPNNKVGVHILDPSEIFDAARLVNSNGGKWGYVTIPIRTDDRDKTKWINFMNNARQNNVIPILRISSYATGSNWVSPPESEMTDFANFLNDLPWPVKNRYIVIYNEPNHAQEWGGYVSPSEYAKLLVTAHDVFKSRSQDFFILSAGMDMSVPTSATSLDALTYYRRMTSAERQWYSSVDGLAVHAYANPGYTSSVWSTTRFGIVSYRYEISLLKSLGFTLKPIFITETGYLGKSSFYQTAFGSVWTGDNIVAITPFVLFAGTGQFRDFSLMAPDRQPTRNYQEIFDLPKTSGSPLLNDNGNPVPTGLSYVSGTAPVQTKPNFFQKIINFLIPPRPVLLINQTPVNVDIVRNLAGQEKGLSGKKSLKSDSGMLFVFEKPSVRTFWMGGMLFPLDFVWINQEKVVNISQNIPAPADAKDRPVILTSSVPVDQVLEVNAGFVSDHQIKIGDRVVINSD